MNKSLDNSLYISSAVLILGATFTLSACGIAHSVPPPHSYFIPKGYKGWVKIVWDVSGAPPLPVRKRRLILRIPPNGILKTSSQDSHEMVVNKDTYYYYDKKGVNPIKFWKGDEPSITFEVPIVSSTPEYNKPGSTDIYIGPEAEADNTPSSMMGSIKK